MSVPATTSGIKQIKELTDLAKEFNYYARGVKQISDARAFKSQFTALKNGISATKKTADTASDAATQAKKITDLVKQGKFKEINPKWGTAILLLLDAIQVGFTTFMVLKNDEILNLNLESMKATEAGVQNAFTRAINNSIQIKGLQEREKQTKVEINDIKEEILKVEVNNNFFKKQINDIAYEVRKGREIVENKISDVKKQANDALYEVRQGRKTLEEKVDAAKKQANDALYEVRKGREILEQKLAAQAEVFKIQINNLKSQFKTNFDNLVNNYQAKVNTTIDGFKQQLQTTKTRQETIDKEIASINQRLRADNQDDSNSIAGKAAKIVLNNVDPRIKTIENTFYGNTVKINTIGDGLLALGGRIKIIGDRVEILEKTPIKIPPQPPQKNYDPAINDLTQKDAQLRAEIDQLNNRLRNQEKVNDSALPKLDALLGLIPAIPGRTAGLINPNIPSVPQIEQATGTAVCRSLNGGCAGRALDNAVNNVNQNANKNKGDLLDKFNAGANAAELALLNMINNKLGAQLPNGLSGFLKKSFEWLQIDRVTNLITLWVTIHNASMLSAQIGDTLLSVIENGLTIFGVKDADGSAIDINSIIGKQVEAVIKDAIGADNYTEMVLQWKRASTIYRSAANVANSVSGLTNSVINGLEVVGSQNAKMGNAFRLNGLVEDNAYQWFNPNPNFKTGGFFDKANNLDEAANFLLQVSQVPIDITQAATEFNNSTAALKTNLQAETSKGMDLTDAAKKKAEVDAAIATSQSPSISSTDFRKPDQ